MQLTEVKKGHIGSGLLLENDGYVSLDDKENRLIKESLENGTQELPNPFILSAVFQKFGIENANGRIYPEDINLLASVFMCSHCKSRSYEPGGFFFFLSSS